MKYYWKVIIGKEMLILYCFIVVFCCFDYNNFIYLGKVMIMLNILNKREIKIYFL